MQHHHHHQLSLYTLDVPSSRPTHENLHPARAESHLRKKRQRRSYSCGMCKLLKIKCDLQTPCSRCVRFKRIHKCLENPPNPPSADELFKIKDRKTRLEMRKSLPAAPSMNDILYEFPSSASPPTIVHSPAPPLHNQHTPPHPTPATGEPQIHGGYHNRQQLPPTSYHKHKSYTVTQNQPLADQGHAQGLNPNDVPHGLYQSQGYVSHHRREHGPSYHTKGCGAYPNYGPAKGAAMDGHPALETPLLPSLVLPDENAGFGAMPPDKPECLGPRRYILPPVSSLQGKCSKGVSLPANFTAYSAIKQLNHLLKVVESQIMLESTTHVHISQADLQEARGALPHDFSEFVALQDNLVLLQGPLPGHIYDHEAIRWQCERLYKKVTLDKMGGDQKPMILSALEARTLSITFLILANGCVLLPDQEETARLWFALASKFKKRVNYINNFVDICYLTDWYYFAKAFNTHMNDFDAILRDLHALLDHISHCTEFLACIGNPYLPTYPVSPEFVLAARYWAHLRIDAFAESRFPARVMAFAIDKLQDIVVPEKSLLESAYGTNLSLVRDPYQRFVYTLWGLYFERHKSLARPEQPFASAEKQLLFFYDVTALVLPGLAEFEGYYAGAISRGAFDVWTPSDMSHHILLYLKVQAAHAVVVEWLVKQFGCGYFPSLAAAQYMTTVCNMFNHFHALNDACIHQLAGACDLLDSLLDEVRYMNLTHLYTSLVYTAVFLVVTGRQMAKPPLAYPAPPVSLALIHNIALDRFRRTMVIFTNHVRLNMTLHRIPFYRDTLRLLHTLDRCVSSPSMSEEGAASTMIRACDPHTRPVLVNHYFGLHDNLTQYVCKLEDCCRYMMESGHAGGRHAGGHAIGRLQVFDDNLVRHYLQGLVGYVTSPEQIKEYVECLLE